MIDAVVTGLAGIILGYFVLPTVVKKSGVSDYVGYKIGQYEYEKAERIKKENEATELFNSRKDEFISIYNEKLIEEFNNNLNFCNNELKILYDNNYFELNNYIDKINLIEETKNIFSEKLNCLLAEISKKMSQLSVNHLNILLTGPSGVGKSFLINAILKLDSHEKAKTKISKPTTKSLKFYNSSKIKNIRLIDSRGIEKGSYNVENFIKEINNFIEQQELNGDPDFFVHCIWYCVTGTRFEEIEEETLKKLSSIYDDSKLPIIVVYTQAMVPEYYNTIKKDIINLKNDLEFIPVVAKDIKLADGSIIKSKNIDSLLLKSAEKAKNAVYSSVYSSLKKIINTTINNDIHENKKKIKENIEEFKIYKNNVRLMKENIDPINIYINILKKYLYDGNNKKNIKNDSINVLKLLVSDFNSKSEKTIERCLNNFVEKKANELSSELLDIQTQVNQEKDGYLRHSKNRKQMNKSVAPIIKKTIQETAFNIGYFNQMNLLPEIISELLFNKVRKEFNDIIADNSTKNILNKKIQSQFQNIIIELKKFKY